MAPGSSWGFFRSIGIQYFASLRKSNQLDVCPSRVLRWGGPVQAFGGTSNFMADFPGALGSPCNQQADLPEPRGHLVILAERAKTCKVERGCVEG